jgi:hypothetical protein
MVIELKHTKMKKLLLLITSLFILASVEGQILRYSNYVAPTPPVEEELRGPDELWDGHTQIWLEHDTLLTESGGAVSKWTDIANSYELVPYAADGGAGTSDNYPSWTESGGVVFDGTDDLLRVVDGEWQSFGTVYLICKQITWTNQDIFYEYEGFDGTDYTFAAGISIAQRTTTPNIRIAWAGEYSTDAITSFSLDTWGLLTTEWIDDAQTLQHNDGTPITWNIDLLTAPWAVGGFILGAGHAVAPAFQRYSNIAVKAVIVRDQIDDSSTKAVIKAYLTAKYLE